MNNNQMTNAEIKSILLNIYDRVGKPSTKEVGYELFLKLILQNLYSQQSMNFIINQIGEFITSISFKEKEPCLKLLSLIFYNNNQELEKFSENKNIYQNYLSSVLSIIQSITKEINNPIFPSIANTYAEIVQYLLPTDISACNEELDSDTKKNYEILQGFCIYNMKQEEKANRIIGSLCLTKLVENCPIVLKENYMKFIWDNIIFFIEKKNYTAKYELLNCLISLILGAENLFSQYANVTLYKVLDFLTEDDWLKRKLALNVIYTLIFYCKEEILPLKEHIINFLRVLKTDKIKEVREVCLLILQIFSENEPPKKKEKSSVNPFKKNNLGNFNENKRNKSRPKTGNVNKLKNDFNKSSNRDSNPFKENDISANTNTDYKKIKKNNVDKRMGQKTPQQSRVITQDLNDESNNKDNNKKEKSNFKFVNEKMVIKPDPNKSIFKAKPNPSFFNQNQKKNDDIVIMVADKPKYNKKNNKMNNNMNNNMNNTNNNMNSNMNNNINNMNKNMNNMNNNMNNDNYRNMNNTNNMDNNFDNKPILKDNFVVKEKKFNDNINDNNYKKKEILVENDKNQMSANKTNKGGKIVRENLKDLNKINRNKGEISQEMINNLLNQIESLSEKQGFLIDIMDNIQIDTQEQLENLNNNLMNLETKTTKLDREYSDFKNGY